MADYEPTIGKTLKAGLWDEIPVFRLVLGMCPTLAVTAAVKPAFTMGMSVLFVLICSNIAVSLMRNLLKPHVRILMFTLTIAAFVTVCDLYLKAFQPEMSEALGPYIPLIIVNCIIICRAEACASKYGVIISTVDAISMGLGFTIALCIIAVIREVLATGAIAWGEYTMPIMWKSFVPLTAMSMPIGAFVTLGLVLGLINTISKKQS
jgi:electron transport complex protein RnfE